MKILYVTTISNTINAFLIPHIKMLVQKGYQVDVASNEVQTLDSELIELGCNFYNVSFERSPLNRNNINAYRKLKNLIKKEKYDIIHTHTPIASVIVRLASRNEKNTQIFYTAHGFHFYKGAPIKMWMFYYPIEKWLSKYTNILITINTEDYNTAISKKFKVKNIKLINGVGIDLDKFTPQKNKRKVKLRDTYGYSKDDFILIYVGELSYRKNQKMLLKSINNIKNKIPNIKLLLVGTGPLKNEYKEYIKEHNLEEQVKMLGYRTDIANLMTLADLAVSTSRQEGLPVNIMEAMATGLPIIATNSRGNHDLIINGKNGFIIELDDIPSFSKKIEILYNDSETKEKFGKRSLELIDKYSMKNILEELEGIYTQIIS